MADQSPMGPFDVLADRAAAASSTFYGFIGGENNQWDPALYEGTTPVEPPATPEEGYHLTEDLDRSGRRVGCTQQKALMPDKPFFCTSRPVRHTHRTTFRRSGSPSTRARSTTVGTRFVSTRSPVRRSWGSFRPTPSSRPGHDEIPACG